MKKTIFLFMLLGLSLTAQTIPSYKNIKLTSVPDSGTKSDSIIGINADGTLTKIKRSDLSGTTLPTLQQILNYNHSLTNGNNFQGTAAGSGISIKTNTNAFGAGAASLGGNATNLNAFGNLALRNNSANNVNAFGNGAGRNNTFNNVNLFGSGSSADNNNQTVFSKWVSDLTSYNARLSFDNITADRNFVLPNKSGTFAMIDDVNTATSGLVSTFNSRVGAVMPQNGDYTASMVGLANVPNVNCTNPNNITQDVTHRFTTDTEKAIWNNKVDKVTGKSLISDTEITRLSTVTNFDNGENVTALLTKLPLSGGKMDEGAEITWSNGSRIGKGLNDNGSGGNKGISLFCSVDYELNWQGGHLTVFQPGSSDFYPLNIDSPVRLNGNLDSTEDISTSGNIYVKGLNVVTTDMLPISGNFNTAGGIFEGSAITINLPFDLPDTSFRVGKISANNEYTSGLLNYFIANKRVNSFDVKFQTYVSGMIDFDWVIYRN